MHIKFFPLLALALAATASIHAASAADPARLERWRSYTGVSWDAPQAGKPLLPFADSAGAQIAGIHFDASGRAFVSTPRLISSRAPATLSVLDTRAQTGPAPLRAFPSVEANAVSGDPATHLRNQGIGSRSHCVSSSSPPSRELEKDWLPGVMTGTAIPAMERSISPRVGTPIRGAD